MIRTPSYLVTAAIFFLLISHSLLCLSLLVSNKIQPKVFVPPNKKSVAVEKVKMDVVTSAISGVAPWLELHHIVLFQSPSLKGAYTIDFSPLAYEDPKTLATMLLGKYVPGEIRARYIPENKLSISEIKDKCMDFDHAFFDRPLPKSSSVTRSLAIESYLHFVKESWKSEINVYVHNCQHFSKFVVANAHRHLNLL